MDARVVTGVLVVALGLAGCYSGRYPDSGDSGDSGWHDESDLYASVVWKAQRLELTIQHGADDAGYDFGLVETAATADGWAGEDCLTAVPAGWDNVTDQGKYQYCHHMPRTGGTLTYVDDADDVVDGVSTLLNPDRVSNVDQRTTLVLFEASSERCWSWGDDPSYYDAHGCTRL